MGLTGFVPGNVLVCEVNAHRAGWDGTVCSQAATWECANRNENFRLEQCANNKPRCFHIHIFSQENPHFGAHDSSLGWVLEDQPEALNDQLLFFYANRGVEPRGVRDGKTRHVVGAYRVKAAFKEGRDWKVIPHDNSWSRFPRNMHRTPWFDVLDGAYLKTIERGKMRRYLDEIKAEPDHTWWRPSDEKSFDRFVQNFDSWLGDAHVRAQKISGPRQSASAKPVRINNPFVNLRLPKAELSIEPTRVAKQKEEITPPPEAISPEVTTPAAPAKKTTADILDDSEWIRTRHGNEVLLSLQVWVLAKPLLILSGSPGVGKSKLAGKLTQDRERVLVQPVSATWRGREDLLGYVNPIDNTFINTPFTDFLRRAEDAWNAGDRRHRIVIFEEFNLSQPEFWLSDILVLAEAEDPKDRKIILCSEKSKGDTSVVLSPALKFVATINADHTTRTLSPRVMDRAILVRLGTTVAEVDRHLELGLDEGQLEAIKELDEILRERWGGFSLRAGRTLRLCMSQGTGVGLESWVAIDVVLEQEVLSKVHLLARDPGDEGTLGELTEWSKNQGQKLLRCSRLIAGWAETIDQGQDVRQA